MSCLGKRVATTLSGCEVRNNFLQRLLGDEASEEGVVGSGAHAPVHLGKRGLSKKEHSQPSR